MEADSLSAFFMKVHAVEEKFLCLCHEDKRKALRILEASLKKLQTLSEACQISVTISTEHQASPVPQKPPRVPEELKYDIKSEKHSVGFDSDVSEQSGAGSAGRPTGTSAEGDTCPSTCSQDRSTLMTSSGREVTPCVPATEETHCLEVGTGGRQNKVTSVKNRNDTTSSSQARRGSVSSPRKRRKPQRLLMYCPQPVEEAVPCEKSDDGDDDNFEGLQTHENSSDEHETSCKEQNASSRVQKKNLVVKKLKPGVMKCGVCSRRFKSEQTLKAHFRSHGFSPCTCLHCHQESMNYAAHLHHHCAEKKEIKTSKTRPKPKAKTSPNSQRGEDEHISSSQGSNLCQICGRILRSETELMLHMKRQHREPQKAIPLHECKFCGRRFVKRVSVFIHFKQHAGNKMVCLKCGEFCENFDAYSEHMAVHNLTATRHCTKCGMKFSGEQQFVQHMRCHDKFDCVLCERHFTRRMDVFRHCRQAHGASLPQSKSKPLQCQVCCRRFQNSAQLQQHSRIHTGERPVHCDVCKRWFRTPKSLNKHKKTRAHCSKAGTTFAEKDYLCSDCGKTFCRREAFRRHLLYHKGVKPHTCQYCGYRCQERNNLNRHIMLHFQGQRNFVCEVCGAAFHAKKTLQMHHSYKHSSERCFTCPHCPLSFKAKNALMRHIKVHTKVKEHRCWCGAAFNRQYNLRRHMRTVHGSDHTLPPLRKVTVLDAPPEDKDEDKVELEGVGGLPASGVDYQPPDTVGALLQHPGSTLEPSGSAMATHAMPGMVLPPQATPQQPPLQQELGGEVGAMQHYHALPPQVSMGDYGGAGGVEMAPPAPPRQQDYYGGGAGMMMDGGSAPVPDLNQYMYIQNILLPSVAMAGLMDLSNSGK